MGFCYTEYFFVLPTFLLILKVFKKQMGCNTFILTTHFIQFCVQRLHDCDYPYILFQTNIYKTPSQPLDTKTQIFITFYLFSKSLGQCEIGGIFRLGHKLIHLNSYFLANYEWYRCFPPFKI